MFVNALRFGATLTVQQSSLGRFIQLFWKTTKWHTFNFIVPLLPLLAGVFYGIVKTFKLTYADILGGTDLYIVIFVALVATTYDFHKVRAQAVNPVSYNGLLALLLVLTILAAFCVAVIFSVQLDAAEAVRLLDVSGACSMTSNGICTLKLPPPTYDKNIVANFGICATLAVALVTFIAQLIIESNSKEG